MERLITPKEIIARIIELNNTITDDGDDNKKLVVVCEEDEDKEGKGYYSISCPKEDVGVALYADQKPKQIVVIDGNVGNKIEDVNEKRIKEIAEILGF